MKAKLIFLAAMVLLAACSSETVVENNQELAPVRVHVNEFSISTEEMSTGGGTTRAAVDPVDYDLVNAIDIVLFASDGSEAYRHTQLKGDVSTFTTFGEFSFTVPVGSYTMVVVARQVGADDVFTLTSPTEAAFTSEKPREVFCTTQSVVVTTTGVDLDVTLNRIVSALNILSTDGRPASATKIRTTFEKGGKSFNPTTGLSLTDNGFTLVNNPSKKAGVAIDITSFQFLTSADDVEEQMDVTIEVLDDGNNVLFTHTVEDVPFKRNYKTTLRGAIFTASVSSAAFKVETAWNEYDPIDF